MTTRHRLRTAGLSALLAITLVGCGGSGEDADLDRSAVADVESDPVDIDPDSSESLSPNPTPDATESPEPTGTADPTASPDAAASPAETPTVGADGEPIELVETSYDISVADVEGSEEPLTLAIPAPGTYAFQVTNDADIVHALTISGNDMQATTGDIEPGRTSTLEVRFPAAGKYDLFCPVANHKELGMDGSVVVEG